MRLKNWSMYTTRTSDFMAPELGIPHLQGDVYGHPRFEDGDSINTSRIIEIQDKGEYKLAITRSGSEYELHKEDVATECEKQFPNYYNRIACM